MNETKIQYVNLIPRGFSRRHIGNIPSPMIGLVLYELRSFYKKMGKHYDKYEWLDTIYSWWTPSEIEYYNTGASVPWEVDNALKQIKDQTPDIVCFTVYVWNFDTSMYLASLVKEVNPNITIIVGGPNVDHAENEQFMANHPYIDYAVYGNGEETFQMLLDSFIEPVNERTIPNLITKEFKTPFKIFRFNDFEPYNPYLDLKEEFIKEYNQALVLRKQIYPNKDKDPIVRPHSTLPEARGLIDVMFERSRGCPYTCTFCDWNGGLHSKVNKTSADWKAEIDFLSQFKYINVQWVDANIGLTKEDVEIMRFSLDRLNGKEQGIHGRNMAKMNKERVAEIQKMRTDVTQVVVALQHIDETVLENIQRPSISWKEQKEDIVDMLDSGKDIAVELIVGLPGATHEKNMHQLHELVKAGVSSFLAYQWELLPNSPGYEKDYQKKYNLKIMDVYKPHEYISKVDEFYKKHIEKDIPSGIHQSKIVYAGTLNEFVLHELYNAFFNSIMSIRGALTIVSTDELYLHDRESYLDRRHQLFNECITYITPLFNMIAKQQERIMLEQLSRYGFVFWGLTVGETTYNWETAMLNLSQKVLPEHLKRKIHS